MEETLPEWHDYFLSYKPLKKRLKQLSAPDFFTAVGFCAASPPHDGSSSSVVDQTHQELRKGSAALRDGGDKPPKDNANEAASSKPASEIGVGNSDEVSSQSSTHAHAGRKQLDHLNAFRLQKPDQHQELEAEQGAQSHSRDGARAKSHDQVPSLFEFLWDQKPLNWGGLICNRDKMRKNYLLQSDLSNTNLGSPCSTSFLCGSWNGNSPKEKLELDRLQLNFVSSVLGQE